MYRVAAIDGLFPELMLFIVLRRPAFLFGLALPLGGDQLDSSAHLPLPIPGIFDGSFPRLHRFPLRRVRAPAGAGEGHQGEGLHFFTSTTLPSSNLYGVLALMPFSPT
jgi:hypothetical protein